MKGIKHDAALQNTVKKLFRCILLAILALVLLSTLYGCGALNGSSPSSGSKPTGKEYSLADVNSRFTQSPPDASSGLVIDASPAPIGYVWAAAISNSRLKFQILCGQQAYNYDLPNDGTPEAFPINMGDGNYTFRIMQNTEGNNYVEIGSENIDVQLESEFAPFLVPNVFCDYEEQSSCVEKARDLTAPTTNQAEVVEEVCTYVAENTSYDTPKAQELSKSTGYIPDPDETLATGRGICFDYASLSAAMLRCSGIPTKVMTGYVGQDRLYHSWIMVYIDGKWSTIFFKVEPNKWSRCDVTFASTGTSTYTGDGTAYEDRYTY